MPLEKKKFHIIQLGCASNQADGIKIANRLNNNNSELTLKIEDANIIIIMSCGFSKKQYQESVSIISQAYNEKNDGAEIWVGGCVPAINKNFHSEFPFKIDKYFTPRNFDSVIKNNGNHQFKEEDIQSLLKIKLKSYPIRIANGCSENCNYCVIKRAGGNTKSKPISEIISGIQHLDNNINSICLVGEEIGSFGEDSGEHLIDLINKIIKIRPEVKITFSAIHPKYFIKDFDQYEKIFKSENIIPLLPLPIQSGSNRILKLMNRDYLIEDIIKKLNDFMISIPNVQLSTDIMVGYPEETWGDFLLTQKMVHELPISALDCFKYDDMKGLGDTIEENDKIKRMKIIALTFIRNYCKEKDINNPKQLNTFLLNSKIPINLNF